MSLCARHIVRRFGIACRRRYSKMTGGLLISPSEELRDGRRLPM